jgi:hypothetical protein
MLMRKPIGITFELGKSKDGWFVCLGKLKLLRVRPSHKGKDARYGGFKFDFCLGSLCRPVPRFWKREFWSRDYKIKDPATNPWNSGNHWFVLRIPWFIGLFLSLSFGSGKRQPGFYLGCKTYEVNSISQGLGRYDIFTSTSLPKKPYPAFVAWGSKKDCGNIYLCPSLSVRSDLVD